MIVTVTSPAFTEGARIPGKYTGEGADVSPPIAWVLPPGTKEVALVCDDPDAPRAEPWVHWVIYALSPELKGLPEGLPKHQKTLAAPIKACQGMNDFGCIGYGGPLPPRGHGVHHYHFAVYALSSPLNLFCGATKARLMQSMRGHIIGEGRLIGTYERK